jgi:branched-chain amino acid aminotransferase
MESLKKADTLWLDGKFVKYDDAKVHVMSHSLHYGLGVFEGIRAYKTSDNRTAVFRLREHMRRLFESAHICLIEMPYTEEQLVDASLELVRINKMGGAYLRPLAFYGDGVMGLGAINKVRVAICVWDWGAYLGDEGLKKGIRARISSFARMHVNANMVRAKITGQYVNSILAKREATLSGYDEAILLDAQGYIAEASGENVFAVRDAKVLTPPLSSPILRGITRDSVIRILRDKGYEVQETTFTRDTLYIADEVFFTGTAAEITPVREVDNRKIGSGQVGTLTKTIQEVFARTVRGDEPRYREWLTYA